jgi:hypothetical protein
MGDDYGDDPVAVIDTLKERVKLIQKHANKLGEIITEQNKKRLKLEDIQNMQSDLITKLEAKLEKIKNDPSIGKLVVEVSEDEEEE